MSRRLALFAIVGVTALIAAGAPSAQATRELLSEELLTTSLTPPEGQVEGACGLAVAPNGDLWVSDYYHGYVDRFSPFGTYIPLSQISVGLHPEGPCGLATDSTGRLYANLSHQSALRLVPDAFGYAPGHVTGIAVDPDTDYFYVDHHNLEHQSYVSVYLPSGAAAEEGGHRIEIGFGSLGDAYGVAVFQGRVYVADASDQSIKVYEPAVDLLEPAFAIVGFVSLVDAALAIDPTNGHLLVVDNLQPGYEHPISTVREFTADGAPLGNLQGKPVFGKPSGIAVNPSASGMLYVTDGNSERSNVFAYGPYQESFAPLAGSSADRVSSLASIAPAAAGTATPAGRAAKSRRAKRRAKRRRDRGARVQGQVRVGKGR